MTTCLTCRYTRYIVVDVKSVQTTKYICDFCGKTSLAAWAMRKHEAWCFFNPTRKCPECHQTGTAGCKSNYVPTESSVSADPGDCPVCLKALCARLNKHIGEGARPVSYSKEQYEKDLWEWRMSHPRPDDWSLAAAPMHTDPMSILKSSVFSSDARLDNLSPEERAQLEAGSG